MIERKELETGQQAVEVTKKAAELLKKLNGDDGPLSTEMLGQLSASMGAAGVCVGIALSFMPKGDSQQVMLLKTIINKIDTNQNRTEQILSKISAGLKNLPNTIALETAKEYITAANSRLERFNDYLYNDSFDLAKSEHDGILGVALEKIDNLYKEASTITLNLGKRKDDASLLEILYNEHFGDRKLLEHYILRYEKYFMSAKASYAQITLLIELDKAKLSVIEKPNIEPSPEKLKVINKAIKLTNHAFSELEKDMEDDIIYWLNKCDTNLKSNIEKFMKSKLEILPKVTNEKIADHLQEELVHRFPSIKTFSTIVWDETTGWDNHMVKGFATSNVFLKRDVFPGGTHNIFVSWSVHKKVTDASYKKAEEFLAENFDQRIRWNKKYYDNKYIGDLRYSLLPVFEKYNYFAEGSLPTFIAVLSRHNPCAGVLDRDKPTTSKENYKKITYKPYIYNGHKGNNCEVFVII